MEKDISKIAKIEIYDDAVNNKSEIYIFNKDGSVVKETYSGAKHNTLLTDYLTSQGIDLSNPNSLQDAISKGVFDNDVVDSEKYKNAEKKYNLAKAVDDFFSEVRVDDPSKNDDKTSKDSDDSAEKEEEEELSEIEKDKKMSTKAKVATALTVLGVAGGLAAIISSCDRQQNTENDKEIDFNTATFDELMSTLSEGSERRLFAQSVYDVTEKLNNLALDKEVFALEADQDAVLQFTYDEVMAAKLVLNNYTGEQLKDIFGMEELNAQEILANYQKFATKMSIYSMNARAASGVSQLITDEANRTWFETLEDTIVQFNKYENTSNSDKLIRTFAYSYQHGINGVDNLSNDEASLSGVKNLMLNMMRGYYDANVEEKYSKHLKVSSNPGEFDDQYRTNKTSQVQKGEKLKFYLDEAEKGTCTISVVEAHLEDTVAKLRAEQEQQKDYEQLLIMKLSETVLDNGDTELANRLMSEGLTEEVEKEFSKVGGDSKKALKAYKDTMEALYGNIPSYTQIKAAADKELGPYIEVKDDVLYNNRIRGLEKINTVSSSTITKDEWDKMSSSEKLEFAKENGTVVSNKTTTTEKEVSYDDLTPSEKVEADKQKEELAKPEVEINGNTYKGDAAQAAKEGWNDATTYAEASGVYSYHTIYNKINPDYPSAVPTNGTLSDIAQAAYAFEGKTITSSDSQIQARLASDVNEFKKKTTDSTLVSAYKSGWLDGINQKLDSAVRQGAITREEAEKLYEQAQAATSNKNNTNTNNNSNNNNTTDKPNNDVVDKEETTDKPSTQPSDKDETPIVSEKPSDNVIDPNLGGMESSDDGFEDIYDENYDSKQSRGVSTASMSEDEYYSYIADLTLEALDAAYAREDAKSTPVLKK